MVEGCSSTLISVAVASYRFVTIPVFPASRLKRASSPFPYGLSPVCGCREGYKVNSRMGPHPGPNIIAATHNIKDTRSKKIFQPSSSSLVSPNGRVSANGRNCIRYRKSCDASPFAGQPDAFQYASIEKKKGFHHELTRMNDERQFAETAIAAIETRPARSAKSWSIEANVKELEPSVTAT